VVQSDGCISFGCSCVVVMLNAVATAGTTSGINVRRVDHVHGAQLHMQSQADKLKRD
jgi:hypothetical protein